MRLAVFIKVLPLLLFPLLSCDKSTALFPWQCDCDIDGIRLSQPSSVTYQVSAYDEAFVSSITYQTNEGLVTAHEPSLPFSMTVQLAKGETTTLMAKGNPGKGSIVLTYEIKDSTPAPTTLSSSVSKVWIQKDGNCQ